MGLWGGDLASPCPSTTPIWEAVSPVTTAHAGGDHQPGARPVERVLPWEGPAVQVSAGVGRPSASRATRLTFSRSGHSSGRGRTSEF